MLHILRLLLLGAAVSACSPLVYGPNFQSVPALEDEGDISFGGSYGSGEMLEFTDLSVAYALAPRVAVMLNGNYAWGIREERTRYSGNGSYFESAIGLFSTDIPGMRFSLYGAYGFGKQTHFVQTGSGIPIRWNRYFLLPAVDMRLGSMSFGLSSRLGYLIFDDGITALEQLYAAYDYSTNLAPNRRLKLFEPALTMSRHWGPLKFSTQIIMMRYNYWNYPFDYYYVGFGVSYTFSRQGKHQSFSPFDL